MTNLTVTGFGPFHKIETNASELIIRQLPSMIDPNDGFRLSTRVFPVIYQSASEHISETIRETSPDILIMLGVSRAAKELQLESVARNLDNSNVPDNQEIVRMNRIINPNDAPDEYRSQLPVDSFVNELADLGIPARVSYYAGGFLCNHYYYLAHEYLTNNSIDCDCLFVHLPNLADHEYQSKSNSKLNIPIAARAVLLLAKQLKAGRTTSSSMPNEAVIEN